MACVRYKARAFSVSIAKLRRYGVDGLCKDLNGLRGGTLHLLKQLRWWWGSNTIKRVAIEQSRIILTKRYYQAWLTRHNESLTNQFNRISVNAYFNTRSLRNGWSSLLLMSNECFNRFTLGEESAVREYRARESLSAFKTWRWLYNTDYEARRLEHLATKAYVKRKSRLGLAALGLLVAASKTDRDLIEANRAARRCNLRGTNRANNPNT